LAHPYCSGEEVSKTPEGGILRTVFPASTGKGGAPGTSNSTRTHPVWPSEIKNRSERGVEFRGLTLNHATHPITKRKVTTLTAILDGRLGCSGKIQLGAASSGFWRKLTIAE
jgi:hypothetical protein